jgi:hypothetical protein
MPTYKNAQVPNRKPTMPLAKPLNATPNFDDPPETVSRTAPSTLTTPHRSCPESHVAREV